MYVCMCERNYIYILILCIKSMSCNKLRVYGSHAYLHQNHKSCLKEINPHFGHFVAVIILVNSF